MDSRPARRRRVVAAQVTQGERQARSANGMILAKNKMPHNHADGVLLARRAPAVTSVPSGEAEM
jgi:hypothetical protein